MAEQELGTSTPIPSSESRLSNTRSRSSNRKYGISSKSSRRTIIRIAIKARVVLPQKSSASGSRRQGFAPQDALERSYSDAPRKWGGVHS